MNILIGVLAALGIIFFFSILCYYLEKKEKEWKELVIEEKKWESKYKTGKEVIEMLNQKIDDDEK